MRFPDLVLTDSLLVFPDLFLVKSGKVISMLAMDGHDVTSTSSNAVLTICAACCGACACWLCILDGQKAVHAGTKQQLAAVCMHCRRWQQLLAVSCIVGG